MLKLTRIFCLLPALWAGSATAVSAEPPPPPGAPLYMKLTDTDVELADRAVQIALESNPSNQGTSWYNRQSGNRGTVTPLRTYRSKSGHYCRRYRERITVNARSESYGDTACRNGSGVWIPLVTPSS